jgi:hypothetical protein
MNVRMLCLAAVTALTGCGYVGVAERDLYSAQISARVDTTSTSTTCSPGRVGRLLLLGGPVFWNGPHNTEALEVLSAEPIEPVGFETVSGELAVLPPDTGGMAMYTPSYLTNPAFVTDVLPIPAVVEPSPARYQVVVTVRIMNEQASTVGILVRYRIGRRTFEDHRFVKFLVKPSCG